MLAPTGLQVTALQRQDAEEEEQRQLLVGFRQQQDVLDGFAGEAATAPGDARRLMLALVQVGEPGRGGQGGAGQAAQHPQRPTFSLQCTLPPPSVPSTSH